MVYFKVELEGKKLYGQNCFPVISLVPGIKFVPLRTNGGGHIPESGLFVRIKKKLGVEEREDRSTSPSNSEDRGKQTDKSHAQRSRAKFASVGREEEYVEELIGHVGDMSHDELEAMRRVSCPAVVPPQRGISVPSALPSSKRVVVDVDVHHLENKRQSRSVDANDY